MKKPFTKNLPFTLGNVPCNGCTLCCKGDAVRLVPEYDDLSQYQLEPHPYHPDQYMLAHKANGDCIYLGDTGCTIHKDRPFMCRTMDCRTMPIRFAGLSLVTRLIRSGLLNEAVYRRGQELLAQTMNK